MAIAKPHMSSPRGCNMLTKMALFCNSSRLPSKNTNVESLMLRGGYSASFRYENADGVPKSTQKQSPLVSAAISFNRAPAQWESSARRVRINAAYKATRLPRFLALAVFVFVTSDSFPSQDRFALGGTTKLSLTFCFATPVFVDLLASLLFPSFYSRPPARLPPLVRRLPSSGRTA
jgi:hypothetical protein